MHRHGFRSIGHWSQTTASPVWVIPSSLSVICRLIFTPKIVRKKSVFVCVCVYLPVRSFSLNWIKGKTIPSAIWLASSEWSEFSWMEKNKNKDYTKISRTAQRNKQKAHLCQTSWGISIYFTVYSDIFWHFLFLQQAGKWHFERNGNCRQSLRYIIKKPTLWNGTYLEDKNKILLFTLILETGTYIAHSRKPS